MSDEISNDFKELQETAGDFKIAPAHGIAAIALSMAMKYHGMQMIPDGLMYQQYKMEGRNIGTIGLQDVFETAIKIELHLLASSDRIAAVLVEALTVAVEEKPEGAEEGEEQGSPSSARSP